MNYYNEFDKKTAAWLRELIAQGLIPQGHVDERSIVDVEAKDLDGYTQCHFFAGIGGWSEALRLAGWPTSRNVWTGSPPCQPFSSAGKRKGAADERHLWPKYFSLIRECKPATVFGEQVAAAISNGWLDAVFTDMESEGYACAASVLPACSVGAAHRRNRIFTVGHSGSEDIQRFEPIKQSCTSTPKEKQPDSCNASVFEGLHNKSNTCPSVWPDGFPLPVVACSGFGNAIVPGLAAQVIGAFMEINK